MKRFINIMKPLTATFCMGITLVCIWSLLRYLLIDDTDVYARLKFHEFYEQENIDVLFLGASHCDRGIDTPLLNQELGLNTYNLGTPSQSLDMSYLLLQEAAQHYDLKQVYMDLNARKLSKKSGKRGNLVKIYLVTDYMKMSVRKIRFLLMNFRADDLANGFLVAHREGKKLFDLSYVSELLKRKRAEGYKTYAPISDETHGYGGRGFNYNTQVQGEGELSAEKDSFQKNIDEIDAEWLDTIKQIVMFCEERNIQLTFISIPMTPFEYYYMDRYESFSNALAGFVMEYDVEFIDFNCLKEEYFPDSLGLFSDKHHLNREGAALFSGVLARYMRGELPREVLFYNTRQERMEALEPNVYGISYERTDDESFHCELVANKPEEIRFCIYAVKLDGEKVLIRDWGSDTAFVMPVIYESGRETITCCIEAKWNGQELTGEMKIPI